HEIDADVLPDLTEADLEKIGVALGPRKKLIRAIAGLSPREAPPSTRKPVPAAPSPSPASRADAERRPITVMFCDLVGSTSLAAKLDAEDWRNLVGAYLDEASAAVTGLGGHVTTMHPHEYKLRIEGGKREQDELIAANQYGNTEIDARILGVSLSYLNKARMSGDGPPFHKFGRTVRYFIP